MPFGFLSGDPMDGYAAGWPDPGLTLTGAKKFLSTHDFTSGFGEPDTINEFQDFVDDAAEDGNYAGKSTEWKGGGRACILKHKLIVSGRFGHDLADIDSGDWFEINKISRINYFHQLNAMKAGGVS